MGAITSQFAYKDRDHSLTVQSLNYKCTRPVDSKGRPYSTTETVILEIIVKAEGEVHGLFQLLSEDSPTDISILYNAKFDPANQLSEYDSAIVFTGYLTEINEVFNAADSNPLLLRIKFLTSAIKYLGLNQPLDLPITQ
ncbi:MAG: hypothetical protein LIP09_16475 [Bacteroidales bacterium]|nr:hypothetical protein [Bacteroidales bacterium]